ncbi:hypothetical protein B0H14DRAFT_3148626 [Mycena olivaceomarginata]|nr:hypothetical protein B0H14DRAFT_3148626 [Mycena olivaceomarginata]
MSSLPQTHNALSQAERSRLVRSTRKLQALLGATPQVIEAAVHKGVNRHVQVYIQMQSDVVVSSAPSSSFSDRRHRSPQSATPRLFLSLDPPAAHQHTLSLLSPSSPLSPTTNTTPNTPPTLSRSLSAKDTRQRRLAKLTRTLGENIAPEMINPPPTVRPQLLRAATTIGRTHAQAERRNVRTVFPAPTTHVPATAIPAPVPVPADVPAPILSLPIPLAPLPMPWVRPPSPPIRRETSSALARSFSTATRSSQGGASGASRPQRHRRAGSLTLPTPDARSRDSALARELEGAQIFKAVRYELQTGQRRKEKEWSGEWNLEMEKVAKRLRSLK